MRNKVKILSISIIIISSFIGFQSFNLKSDNNYQLTISEGKIIKENKKTYFVIPTTLNNSSC